jgi:hypothetical protein
MCNSIIYILCVFVVGFVGSNQYLRIFGATLALPGCASQLLCGVYNP